MEYQGREMKDKKFDGIQRRYYGTSRSCSWNTKRLHFTTHLHEITRNSIGYQIAFVEFQETFMPYEYKEAISDYGTSRSFYGIPQKQLWNTKYFLWNTKKLEGFLAQVQTYVFVKDFAPI